jgi:multiple sugar transport system permease protein
MIPRVLDESAYIDGAGRFKIFYKIGVPLSIQTMIVSFLFNVVWYWNDSYRASLFLSGSKWTTLIVELTSFEKRYEYLAENASDSFVSLNEPLIMAGTILTILPLLILYFATQKNFVESIDKTGLAGGE